MDIRTDVPWRMERVTYNGRPAFMSAARYTYEVLVGRRRETREALEPVRVELTDGRLAVLVAWR
jgi:hypothetical protein